MASIDGDGNPISKMIVLSGDRGSKETKKGESMAKKKHYVLTITPAIPPIDRHKIQMLLEDYGYHIIGGRTDTDKSSCDISFEK